LKPQPLAATATVAAAASATVPAQPGARSRNRPVLPARIYFASGSAALDANAREALRSIRERC